MSSPSRMGYMPQPRVGSRSNSREVSPRSSLDHARLGDSGGYGGGNGNGYVTAASNGNGLVISPTSDTPGVPIPGGWPSGGPNGPEQQWGGQASNHHNDPSTRGPSGFTAGPSTSTSYRTPQPGVGAYGSRPSMTTSASSQSQAQGGGGSWTKLPRITTSTPDGEKDDGPHSAPARPAPLIGSSPLRSSSTPNPNQVGSGGSSPTDSHSRYGNPSRGESGSSSSHTAGLATSNGPPVPYYAPGQGNAQLQFPTPQLPAPPRSSSYLASSPVGQTQPGAASSSSSHTHSVNVGPMSATASVSDSPLTAQGQVHDQQQVPKQGEGQSALQPTTGEGQERRRDRAGTDRSERSERTGRSRGEPTYCGQCEQVVHGQFVRAMGKVYHLNCFRCKDCNKVVAQKFFPVEDGEGMYPLCERDYFARLDLICAKCDQALRSSYITACGEKYHVEHFTCSECDVVFGPNDSYYEHGSKVYCHFHYSTRFAVKCVGCETAILKQFVEMNRNGKDECWHPECYMISKFWNVRLASKNFSTPANSAVSSAVSLEMTPTQGGMGSAGTVITSGHHATSPAAADQMTPEELKERQESMEMKVLQIWHVLSGYEESSAALIGEMLRAVNGRNLLEIVLLAERFILHVEALFAVIDDLEAQFALAGIKGMSHAREAKQLCRKLVNLFSTMSQINPHQSQPQSQDLYNLITQLAHYLKILIRIALTGSIKLEREQGNSGAMMNTLARLNLLSMDGGDPTVVKRGDYPEITPGGASGDKLDVHKDGTATPASGNGNDEEQLKKAIEALPRRPRGWLPSTQEIAYGYRSLAPEITQETTLRGPQDEDFVPPEGCATCQQAIEEDCIRQGMFNRWHSPCVSCAVCGDRAVPIPAEESDDGVPKYKEDGSLIVAPKPKRPPPRVDDFLYELPSYTIYCSVHQTERSEKGFAPVSRLEQYAFLLHIALRRLYVHFRMHHDLPSVRDRGLADTHHHPDIKRVKSVVTLDRKLSSTARMPQRSMVVESPAGRIANEDGRVVSARSQGDHSGESGTPPPATSGSGEGGAADDDDTPQSATVDVIRPPFARNNTSVLIINENNPDLPPEVVEQLQTHLLMQEDDAITLGDIPLLADQSIRHRSPPSKPLLANLNHLQSLILKHFALLQLQKSGLGHLIELDEVLELMDVRKSQWWNKIFKGNAKDKQKKKGTFGVPLEILVERTGSDSQQGSSNATLRVPEFIEEIIATMRQMDMAIEGIFRKNGNIRRLQQISEALDKDSTNVNLSEENPVQLAALLKRFLRELPDPLLTFKLHKLFCAAASYQAVEERQRCLHLLICLLPRYNRDTMEVLFVFLKWVASFSYKDEETGSRMDMANLATVICPSILYAKGANAARDESFIAITAIQDMLENQDEYFTVPNELLFVINENIYNIFSKDLDLPPKEIHRHCSKYMQARGPAARLQASMSGQVREGARGQQGGQPAPGQGQGQGDSRLSVHRSEGNLAAEANGGGLPHSHSNPYSNAVGASAPQSGSGHSSHAGHGQGPAQGFAQSQSQSQSQSQQSHSYSHPPSVPHSPYRGTPLSSPTPPHTHAHPHPLPHPPAQSHGSRPSSWLLATHGSQQNLQAVPSSSAPGQQHQQSSWKSPFHPHASSVSGNGSRTSSRSSAPGSPGPEGRGSLQLERDREGRWTPLI